MRLIELPATIELQTEPETGIVPDRYAAGGVRDVEGEIVVSIRMYVEDSDCFIDLTREQAERLPLLASRIRAIENGEES